MVDNFALWLQLVFNSCLKYFNDIFRSTGATNFWLSCILIVLSFKFLLAPIFGHSGSDKARKNKSDNGDDN